MQMLDGHERGWGMDLATVGYCSSVVMYEKLPSDMVEGLRSRARRERRFLLF